jgi:hypothetical protein
VLIAQAKICPSGGHGVLAAEPSLQAGYDTSELPPVTPLVTRVAP